MKKDLLLISLLFTACQTAQPPTSQEIINAMERESDTLHVNTKSKQEKDSIQHLNYLKAKAQLDSETNVFIEKSKGKTTNIEPSKSYIPAAEIQDENDKLVEKLIGEGVIKINMELYKVYINPGQWAMIDIMQKENVTMNFLKYFKKHSSEHFDQIEIYDLMTGKKLAEYGPLMGFSIED